MFIPCQILQDHGVKSQSMFIFINFLFPVKNRAKYKPFANFMPGGIKKAEISFSAFSFFTPYLFFSA